MAYFEDILDTPVLGDSLDILTKLPDACVDAVVTDPPFGIGFKYEDIEEHNTPEKYWAWLNPIYQEMIRVTKPGGFIAIWQSQKYYRHFWNWFGDDIHIYAACKNFVQLRKTWVNYGYDPVIIRYLPGAPELRPAKPRRNVDFYVTKSHARLLKPNLIEKEHPCPRPLDGVQEVIENFVIEGAVVLDPFLGSGTTAIACLNTNRRFIGVEQNPTYHNLSLRRIRMTTNFFGELFD